MRLRIDELDEMLPLEKRCKVPVVSARPHALWAGVRLLGIKASVEGFGTVLTKITLALGIGANTAIFSIINSALLDPGVVGRRIMVDGTAREIIGVLPKGFWFMDVAHDLVLPLRFERAKVRLAGYNFQGIGRLRPGVSIEAANADVAAAPYRARH